MTELFEKDGIQYIKNLIRESYYEKRIAFEIFSKIKNKSRLRNLLKTFLMSNVLQVQIFPKQILFFNC